jgi:hypothetical protein
VSQTIVLDGQHPGCSQPEKAVEIAAAAAGYTAPSPAYNSPIWGAIFAKEHVVVMVPRGCSAFAGLGSVVNQPWYGGYAYLEGSGGMSGDPVAHELGHNIGLLHASAFYCADQRADVRTNQALPAGCQYRGYADLYDVMGYSRVANYGALSAPALARIGLDSTLNPVRVPAGTSSQTATLTPMGSMSGTRAVSITDPLTGEVYWVEFRADVGYDNGIAGWQVTETISASIKPVYGFTAGVRITKEATGPETWPQGIGTVYALRPVAANNFDTTFKAGQRFVSASGAVSVQVNSITGTGAAARASVSVSSVVPSALAAFSSVTTAVTGTRTVGQTLTANPTSSPAPSGVQFSYVWKRGTTTVGTARTYAIVAADVGQALTVTVSAVAAGYSARDSAAIAVGAISRASFSATGVVVTGTRSVGQTLTANPSSTPSAGVTYSYVWKRGTTTVGTAKTYKLVAADSGKPMTVQVTANLDGYNARASAVVSTGAITTPPVPAVVYSGHVENIGWQTPVANGAIAGTFGRSLRVEALRLSLQAISGGIECRAHVQNIGWMSWVPAGRDCGTSGQALRVEAFQVRLTGDAATKFDVHYRTHAQNFGWLGWAKNGAQSGTAGFAYRLEAVQIVLVAKGGAAPGPTAGAFHQR